jgi:hypothetical protein
VAVSAATPARATTASPDAEHAAAVDAFKRGTQLVEAGRLEAAIDAFREALAYEPASVGARLDLADCYEKIGSPAAAWRQYAVAEVYARRASDPRRELARSSAAHLESSVLVVTLDGPRPAGFDARIDGEPIPAELLERSEIAVAPGRHRIDFLAANKRPAALDVAGAAGDRRAVTIAFGEDTEAAPPPVALEVHEAGSSGRRTLGIALGAVGLASLAVGAATGGVAVADRSSLLQESRDASVTSGRFYSDRSTADAFANVSTITLVAGGAALVAGVVLYVTAPSSRPATAFGFARTLASAPGRVTLSF